MRRDPQHTGTHEGIECRLIIQRGDFDTEEQSYNNSQPTLV